MLVRAGGGRAMRRVVYGRQPLEVLAGRLWRPVVRPDNSQVPGIGPAARPAVIPFLRLNPRGWYRALLTQRG